MLKKLSEEEVLKQGRLLRWEKEEQDKLWLARRKKRHRNLMICGTLIALICYGISTVAGHVSVWAWLMTGISGAGGGYLLSKYEFGIFTSALIYGLSLIIGTGISYFCGWWDIGIFQTIVAIFGFMSALMAAAWISLFL